MENSGVVMVKKLNTLSGNLTKWSNTVKQFRRQKQGAIDSKYSRVDQVKFVKDSF